MSIDLTGIGNRNEYYTNHYFSTMFEDGASERIKQWSEESKNQDTKTPWTMLRDNAKRYYPIHDRYDRGQPHLTTANNIITMAAQYLLSMGYGTPNSVTINVDDDSENAKHTFVNLTRFVDIYSNGVGLNLTGKAFSIKLNATASGLYVDVDGLKILVDPNNANGLNITANGLKLALATQSAAGAMSATDKTNLDGLVEDMDMTLATDAEIASWMGYDITGTPAVGSEAAQIKAALEGVSSDSITDEPGA